MLAQLENQFLTAVKLARILFTDLDAIQVHGLLS